MKFEKPWYINHIALYSKRWYGFGDNPYDELNIIFNHLCGVDNTVPRKEDIFLLVSKCFYYLINESKYYHIIEDMYKNVLFPWHHSQNYGNTIDEKFLHAMLGGIRMHEIKFFDPLIMDAKIARLFINGQERIDWYKNPEKGYIGEVINE